MIHVNKTLHRKRSESYKIVTFTNKLLHSCTYRITNASSINVKSQKWIKAIFEPFCAAQNLNPTTKWIQIKVPALSHIPILNSNTCFFTSPGCFTFNPVSGWMYMFSCSVFYLRLSHELGNEYNWILTMYPISGVQK